MERSQLKVGDLVAVYVRTPVPADPYNDYAEKHIERCEVLDPHPKGGGVIVDVLSRRNVQVDNSAFASRQIIALWSDYVERREARHDKTVDGRRQRRLEVEGRALTSAQQVFPTATIERGRVVIEIPDWNDNVPW